MAQQQQAQPQAKPPRFGDPVPGDAPAPKPKPIPRERAIEAEFVVGRMLNITLPEDQTIEEGPQDPRLWELVGPRLAMWQWLQVTNDAGSMFRLMRVARVHTAAGSGLRALDLRDLTPPRFFDVLNEPIASTGEWYVRYLGPHRRWAVINPSGAVRREGIHSHAEANNVCHTERGNPPPL